MLSRVDDGDALQPAFDLARVVAVNGPLSPAATKQVVRQAANWSWEDPWKDQRKVFAPVFRSADAKEGAAAFAERRMPQRQGS